MWIGRFVISIHSTTNPIHMLKLTTLHQNINNREFPYFDSIRAVRQMLGYRGGSNVFTVESENEFMNRVVHSSVPVLVEFHARWRGSCRNLGPRLEAKINGRNGKIILVKVDIDCAGDGLVEEFHVSTVPTIIAFRNGIQFGRFEGDVEDEVIENLIRKLLNECK